MLKKRSVKIAGHATSLTLEEPFWNALKEIAAHEGKTVTHIIESVDADRTETNLSSAMRVYILEFYISRLLKNLETDF
jgi:predicted DNA-binding ribbon-helix-helix protein